jgi:hypothetical protein
MSAEIRSLESIARNRMGIEASMMTGLPFECWSPISPMVGIHKYHKIDEITHLPRHPFFDEAMATMTKTVSRVAGKDRQAGNGPTMFALLGKELGLVINQKSTENKDGKPTPGGKVYARH